MLFRNYLVGEHGLKDGKIDGLFSYGLCDLVRDYAVLPQQENRKVSERDWGELHRFVGFT